VAVFKYHAVNPSKEENHEYGTVYAEDKIQAFDKLTRRQLTNIRLKRLKGLNAWLARIKGSES